MYSFESRSQIETSRMASFNDVGRVPIVVFDNPLGVRSNPFRRMFIVYPSANVVLDYYVF